MAKEMDVLDSSNVILDNKIYDSSFIPNSKKEMYRNFLFKKECKVGGSIFGRSLEVKDGPFIVNGSIVLNEDAKILVTNEESNSIIKGCVQAERSIICDSKNGTEKARLVIEGDVHTDILNLSNTFVYGNIFCKSAIIKNSVILGHLFAERRLELNNSIVGTFTSRTVKVQNNVGILIPTVICENIPEFSGKMFYCFLESSGQINNTIEIYAFDLIQNYYDNDDAITNIISPKFIIGLGNRILNAEKIYRMMENSAEVLVGKYTQSNIDNRNPEKENVWEKNIMLSIKNLNSLNLKESFNLELCEQ